MANSGQPTKHTRHIDTKHFAIQDWVANDILILRQISTHDNEADTMTKNLARSLFYRHKEYMMGKVLPEYAIKRSNNTSHSSEVSRNTQSTGG